jgi:hypothetical protein
MTITPEGDQHVLAVHVTNHPAPPAPRTPRYRAVYYTVTLTDAGRSEQLLAAATDRHCAYVQPLDDDVAVSGNQSDAASGTGSILPKTNTQPAVLADSAAVYVAAPTMAGATSRVSVIDVHCVA